MVPAGVLMEVDTFINAAVQGKEILAQLILGVVILYTYIKIIPLILFHKDQRLADVLENVGKSLDRFATVVETHSQVLTRIEDKIEDLGTLGHRK
jgi:hypothetical protein